MHSRADSWRRHACHEQKTTGAGGEKAAELGGGENTVSVNMGKKTLYLCNLQDIGNPIELQFQPNYGALGPYKVAPPPHPPPATRRRQLRAGRCL